LDETRRWVPAAAITWGLFGQGADASVVSSPLSTNPSEPVRPAASDSETLLNPFVGGSVELMTPRMLGSLGRPRAFAHVDVTAALGFSYDVAKEGTPGTLIQPEVPTPEASVLGQGSVTAVQVEPLVVSAGAGVAFTADSGPWRLRIKPSFEYIREEIQVSGIVNRAATPNTACGQGGTPCRLIRLEGQETTTYHGIGPGLELEVDAARIRSFMMTVFVSAQAYALLGDLDVVFGDTHTDPLGTESAIWRFRPDDWLYRGAMGVRFRWLPDRDR